MKRLLFYSFGLLTICFLSPETAKAQVWDSVSSGLQNSAGVLGVGTSMCIYNNQLYVGGGFKKAGEVTAEGIARWDGSIWDSVGGGNHPVGQGGVNAMAVYNNELYTVGAFDTAGNLPIHNVARWNGTDWNAVGDPSWDSSYLFSQPVYYTLSAAVVYNNELYVGGAKDLVKWNGSSWDYVTQTSNNWHGGDGIQAMAVYNGELYVCGTNNILPTQLLPPWRQIYKWNGEQWDTVAALYNEAPYTSSAMYVFNNELYIAGGLYIIGNDTTSIARYNGTSWSAVGPKADDHAAFSFCSFNNNLYVGGGFYTFRGEPMPAIAKWDGNNFDSVTTNRLYDGAFDTRVYAMAVYDNQLYATGNFTAAQTYPYPSNPGYSLNNIARLIDSCQAPVASFTAAIHDSTLILTNTSTNAASWLWNFGNGNTSTLQNPPAQSYNVGTYQVTLTSYGNCVNASFDSSITTQIFIMDGDSSKEEGIVPIIPANQISVYPIPGNNEITITGNLLTGDNYSILLADESGRKITPKLSKLNKGAVLDVSEMMQGIYYATIRTSQEQVTKKVIIAR